MSSAPVTNTKVERVDLNALASNLPTWGHAAPPADVAWLCGLLQAGDSFYPTGTYAHSFGLEGLVHADVVRDRATLRQFIQCSVLPALRHVDQPLAAHASRAWEMPDWSRIGVTVMPRVSQRRRGGGKKSGGKGEPTTNDGPHLYPPNKQGTFQISIANIPVLRRFALTVEPAVFLGP